MGGKQLALNRANLSSNLALADTLCCIDKRMMASIFWQFDINAKWDIDFDKNNLIGRAASSARHPTER